MLKNSSDMPKIFNPENYRAMKKKSLKIKDSAISLPPQKTTKPDMFTLEKDFIALLEFNKIHYRRQYAMKGKQRPNAYFVGSNIDLYFRFTATDWGDERVFVSRIVYQGMDMARSICCEHGIEFTAHCIRSMLAKVRERGFRFRTDLNFPCRSIYFVLLKPKRTHPYWACKW